MRLGKALRLRSVESALGIGWEGPNGRRCRLRTGHPNVGRICGIEAVAEPAHLLVCDAQIQSTPGDADLKELVSVPDCVDTWPGERKTLVERSTKKMDGSLRQEVQSRSGIRALESLSHICLLHLFPLGTFSGIAVRLRT